MKRTLMLMMLFLLLAMPAAAQGMLSVDVPDDAAGYSDNPLIITCEEAGLLTVDVLNADGEVYRIADQKSVEAGETTIVWDGLAAWDRPLEKGVYTIRATLTVGAETHIAEDILTVTGYDAALVFALPSGETFYQKGKQPLEITYCVSASGRVAFEFYSAEEPENRLYITRKNAEPGRIYTFEWNGKINDQYVAEGDYIIRVYLEERPEDVTEVSVTAMRQRPDAALEAASIMPDEDTPLWEAVTAQAVVPNVPYAERLQLYIQPDTASAYYGMVYGQMQCVEILETDAEWTKVQCWNQEDGGLVPGWVQTIRLKTVDVNTEYALVLDKNTQMLTVYRHGEEIGSMQVATGAVAYGMLDRETPAGSYILGDRMQSIKVGSVTYEYAFYFCGGRCLYLAEGEVGQKRTDGNVAVSDSVDETQLSAYWIWSHIPKNTRLIILDDQEQRLMENAAAQAQFDGNADDWRVMETAESLQEGETEIIMTFGGDAAVGTRERWMTRANAFPNYISQGGMGYPFSGLQEYFATDDMTLVNLETVLKSNANGEDTERSVRIRGLPSWAYVLIEGSIENVNIANNHHYDYGTDGSAETLATLEAFGIPYSGFGNLYIWEFEGRKIGFGGCREATWLTGEQNVTEEITALREAGCDVIIYSCHWGTEYEPTHNATQNAMVKEIVAAGADIIIGHHPHVVQGVEDVDGTLVVYSLGNLMFGGTHKMKTFDGAIARVSLRFDENGYAGASLTMIPILTSTTYGVNDYRPILAQGEDALRIMAKIQVDSNVLLRDSMFFPAK